MADADDWNKKIQMPVGLLACWPVGLVELGSTCLTWLEGCK
jgi:hypothetical protein